MATRRPSKIRPAKPEAPHIREILRASTLALLMAHFLNGWSVRALVKKFRLSATGVEDAIRAGFRA